MKFRIAGLAAGLALAAPCLSWSMPAAVILAASPKKPAKIKPAKAPAPENGAEKKAPEPVSLDAAEGYNYFHLVGPQSAEPPAKTGPAMPAKAPKAPAGRAAKL